MSEAFNTSGESSNITAGPAPALQGLFIPGIDNPLSVDGFGIVTPWGGGSTARRYRDYGIPSEISKQSTQLYDLASSLIPAEGDGISFGEQGPQGIRGLPGPQGLPGIVTVLGLNLPQNSNFVVALPHNIDQINSLGLAADKMVYTDAYNSYFTFTWVERQPAGDTTKKWRATASSSDGSRLIVAVFAISANLYTSDDYGVTWTERTPEAGISNYLGVASDSDGSHLIVTGLKTNSKIWTSADYGVTWVERKPTADSPVFTGTWHGVASNSDGSKLIAGGSWVQDECYTSADYGATWTPRRPGGIGNGGPGGDNASWAAFAWGQGGNTIIAAGTLDARGIWTSANSGVNWSDKTPSADVIWDRVASDSDGSHLMAAGREFGGSDEFLFISSNSGASWTRATPAGGGGGPWDAIAIDADGSSMIAAENGGRVYVSLDSGDNWSEEQPAGDSNQNWQTVASNSDGTRLVAAYYNGRLYTGELTSSYSEATWAESDLTSAGRALLDDANAAAQATTLGLGTGDAVTHDTLTLSSIAAEGTDVDKFLVDSTGVVKFRTGAEVLSDIGASASAHLHDTQTLQHDAVNSDGGAFSFTTTGLVTFNQSIAAANYAAANLLTAAASNAGELDFTVASKKLDVEDSAVVSQDYSSDASPEFTGLTLSGITQGSVVFAGASGVISQDNSNLFWDDTNKRLKIKGDIVYHGTSYILSGMSEDRQDMFLTTSAGNVFFETEKIGGGDIEYLFDEIEYDLDCTTGSGAGGRARVQLTEGSATNPQINYVYITLVASTATLTASTSLPTGQFAWVALVVIQSDTEIDAVGGGPLAYQRFTETYKHDSRGALSYMREKIRYLGADYLSGLAQSLTITANGGADTVVLTTALGKVYQLHRQDWPTYDISSDGIWVANASGAGTLTKYQRLTDLNSVLETSDGTVIGNNKRFNLVIWGSVNLTTGDCKMFVNLPTDVYQDNDQTISDENGTAVTTIPAEFQTTGFLIARLPLKYSTAGGGTWTNLMGGTSVIDLRGLPTGFNLGSGATVGATATFSDADFEIFDNGDDTKRLMFQVSGVSAGNTRTLTIPDVSGTLVTSANPEDLGGVLQDLDTLGAVGADGEFLVGTGVGVLAWESGATARTSIGLGNVSNVATSDTAYNATSWNANADAATKNTIRDKVETMDTAIGSNTTHRGLTSGNPHSVTPTELSLVIGTNTQAWDAGLDSLAGLGYVSDSMIKITAEDTYAIRTLAEVKTDLSLNNVENTVHSTDAHTMTIDGRDVSVDGTKLDGIEALADVTATAETSHADVLQDGDFGSNGLMERTGAGSYGIKVIGTDVQAFGAVLDDLNTLGAPASDGQFIVATGAGVFAYESTTTARTSLGVGTGDSPTLAGLTLGNGTLFIAEQADAAADVAHHGQVWVHDDVPNTLWFTDENGNDYPVIPQNLKTTDSPIFDVLTLTSPLFVAEQAAADGDVAHYGQVWIKNDTPNTLWFTNENGTDYPVIPQDLKTTASPTFVEVTLDKLKLDNGTLFVKEQANAAADIAHYGQIWIKGDVPNTLWFTDENGNDYSVIPQDLQTSASPTFDVLTLTSPLFIAEQAVADADVAHYGQIWVKNDVPNTLWFTNENGTDLQLNLAVGTDIQAYDAGLASLAALSYVSASFVKMTGANTFALRTIGETADDLQGTIDHDLTANYDANKHIDHTGVTLTAGSGIAGGGDISAGRSFDLDINSLAAAAIAAGDFVPFWDITAVATNKKITFANFEAALTHDNLIAGTIASHDITATGAEIDTHLGLANEHIDWTSTAENLDTTGTIDASGFQITAVFASVDIRSTGNRAIITCDGSVGNDADIVFQENSASEWVIKHDSGSGSALKFIQKPGTDITVLELQQDGGILMPALKSGTDQADAGAAAGELYVDTDDDNTVKMGV